MPNAVIPISPIAAGGPSTMFSEAHFPFESFNPVQAAIAQVADQDANFVIASGTGSGKTVVAEMVLAHEVRTRGGKGLFAAPLRALVTEKLEDWTREGHHFKDLGVSACTGDYRITADRDEELAAADLLVFSTEMLASRGRKGDAANSLLRGVGTCVIDECHLLGVHGRGDHLEVGLMKLTKLNPDCRLVALSATLPNVGELASWLTSLNGKPTYLLETDWRPVPLTLHWDNHSTAGGYEEVERSKVSAAMRIIRANATEKILVFAWTKRTGEKMREALAEAGEETGFHSGDLDKAQRHDLEQRFKYGDLRVLVATSTLAWGCHTPDQLLCRPDGGLTAAGDLQVGDELTSWNGQYAVAATVTATSRRTSRLLRVTLMSGEVAVVSEDHAFGILPRDKESVHRIQWVEAQDLTTGDEIATRDPRAKLVTSSVYVLDNQSNGLLRHVRPRSIEDAGEGEVVSLEVAGTHAYFGAGGMLSHNCNTPADRVIILGVHRGISEVESYDVKQAVGRAGRPGWSTEGNAHILLPRSRRDEFMANLTAQDPIRSRLLDSFGKEDRKHYKTLAFHLVSEIAAGDVTNREQVDAWVSRSFAKHQEVVIDEDILDATLEALQKVSAIRENEGGELEATAAGQIAAAFYFSPFDLHGLRGNFNVAFSTNRHHDDVVASIALASIDSHRYGIASRAEKDAFEGFRSLARQAFGTVDKLTDPVLKVASVYHALMNGRNPGIMVTTARQLQADFPRIVEVLVALDQRATRWHKEPYFRSLEARVTHGVPVHLVPFVTLAGVGKKKAETLYKAGIKSRKDLITAGVAGLTALEGFGRKTAESIIASARA